jgi:stringent starvation protein B
MTELPASKEAVVLQLLAEGDVMLCLDARHAGVRVPAQHAHDPALRLVLNMHFPHPIEVTADGISANLAFGGRRFACYVPMAALWAAFNPQNMQGMMWPEAMPPEVQADLVAQQQSAGQTAPPDTPPQAATRLRSVRKPRKAPAGQKQEEPPPPRQRGHLRVIK